MHDLSSLTPDSNGFSDSRQENEILKSKSIDVSDSDKENEQKGNLESPKSNKRLAPVTPEKEGTRFRFIKDIFPRHHVLSFDMKYAAGNFALIPKQAREAILGGTESILMRVKALRYLNPPESKEMGDLFEAQENVVFQLHHTHKFAIDENLIPVTIWCDEEKFEVEGQLFVHLSPSIAVSGKEQITGIHFCYHSEELSHEMDFDMLIPVNVNRLIGYISNPQETLNLSTATRPYSDFYDSLGKPWNRLAIFGGAPEKEKQIVIYYAEEGVKTTFSKEDLSAISTLLVPKILPDTSLKKPTPFAKAIHMRAKRKDLDNSSEIGEALSRRGVFAAKRKPIDGQGQSTPSVRNVRIP